MSSEERQLNLHKREEKILEFWERNKIFEKTLTKTKKGKPFVFYEGPPTANAAPGFHSLEARVFKDVIPRYRTMCGFFVERKAGWDTHGLPVELQVEKALGFKKKQDIEHYGIARFNAKCREIVWQYKEEWDRFTKRIGFWLDLEHPYITYKTSYIETLWWIIKKIWKKGLLYRDFKVVPWCPRCETALSTHELGQGYRSVKDRSVYVRFRLKATDKKWANASILSWTTTPWTLPGNVALAIHPEEKYVALPDPAARNRRLILGLKTLKQLSAKKFFPPEYKTLKPSDVQVFLGKELLGLQYQPLFPVAKLSSKTSHRVYAADFVSMEEGTGVVHTAVMYGEDDYQLGKKVGLPTFHTVTETGHFIKEVGEGLGGLYVKDPKTEEKIIASLKRRELLFRGELYEHDYPFCWRCETPVLYYARYAWWVKMSDLRKDLVKNNESINWVPEYIKRGRFGEFLREVRDWAFSRERYWGTPLPVWQCEKCKHEEVIGSLAELDEFDPAPTTLVLMRHGQAQHNVKNLINPVHPDNDRKNTLTALGQRQILAAAKKLKKEGIEVIVASPSLRAQETAKIVGETLGLADIYTIPDLYDFRGGAFEGRPIADFYKEFSRFEERFYKKPGGAENLRELKSRMMRACATIRQRCAGKKVLAVSHGDPIWVLMAALEGRREADYEQAPYLKPAAFRTIQLHNWPYDDSGEVNLHRPFVDFIRLSCPKCASPMRRVPEVADVWFDSGAMPFAQAHFPFAWAQNQNSKFPGLAEAKPRAGKIQNFGERDIALAFKKLAYPADYICEAMDQTRGWFYTLLAVSTVLGRGASYKNAISLGHVVDKNGQKMSKSRGNVVDPWAMIEKYGTDAIRWYFYTINAPGDPKRFDEKDIQLRLRGALSTFWNSFVFFDTYVDKIQNSRLRQGFGGQAKSKIQSKLKAQNPKNALDAWVIAKLENLTGEVTARLNSYDIVGAARTLDKFIVEDFSNWYLRRSRRRFQKPETKKEKNDAAAVTAFVLARLCELMAPFTPFLAEAVYQELKRKLGLKEGSVHLRKWPAAKLKVKSLSRAESRDQKLKVLLDEMSEVRRVAALALAERAKVGIKVRQPLSKLKVKSLKLKVRGLLDLIREEVNVKEVVADLKIAGEVELDMHITAELREEGLMRELVRNIQEMRRDAGMKPQQSAILQVAGSAEFMAAIERWQKFIAKEAGVKKIQFGAMKNFMVEREVKLNDEQLRVAIDKYKG